MFVMMKTTLPGMIDGMSQKNNQYIVHFKKNDSKNNVLSVDTNCLAIIENNKILIHSVKTIWNLMNNNKINVEIDIFQIKMITFLPIKQIMKLGNGYMLETKIRLFDKMEYTIISDNIFDVSYISEKINEYNVNITIRDEYALNSYLTKESLIEYLNNVE